MQQFKIGDWVLEIHSEEIHQIIELFPDVCRIRKPILGITYSTEYTDLKLWQPQKGEWCWFWNGYSKYTLTLGRLAEYSEEEKLYFSYNGVVYMSYEYCEPFIGELPSFLKE